MPDPVDITAPKQLLVEGADDAAFIQALISHLHISDFQVQRFGGVNELRGFLKAFRLAPNFTTVVALGIVRDADRNADGAFRSVQSALWNAGLPMPSDPQMVTAGPPYVAVCILPDSGSPGTLETLCLQSVTSDPALACVDEYIQCVERCLGALPGHRDKARVHAFLASRSRPEVQVGQAAVSGYWPWDNPCFDAVKRFLQAL